MPHQCVKCSRMIESGSGEIIQGCKECGGRFFFYIKEGQLEELKNKVIEIPEQEKEKVEKDIREIAGITDEEAPVILDIESIRVTGEGKFELDLTKLFQKGKPLVYKLEEGKYIIDLASTLKKSLEEGKKKENEKD